ncbi:MAG: hypothetical protein OHK0029_19170 [Armatimonadaceae bacterium]
MYVSAQSYVNTSGSGSAGANTGTQPGLPSSAWAQNTPTGSNVYTYGYAKSVYKQTYTWSGSTPTTGTFKVNGSGSYSGSASIGASQGYVSAGATSTVTFPGGNSTRTASAFSTTTFDDYNETPAGLINVVPANLNTTTVEIQYTLEASASGNTVDTRYAGYSAESTITYTISGIVP